MNARKSNTVPSLSYSGKPSGPEYERWREEFCRRMASADIEPTTEGPFRHELAAVPLRGVTLTAGAGSAVRFKSLTSGGQFILLMPEIAPLILARPGRQVALTSGQLALADASVPNGSVTQTDEGSYRTIVFDRERLLSVCPQAEELIARPLDFTPGNGALLRQYASLVFTLAPSLDAAGRHTAGQHLFDLAALILGGRQDFAEEATNRGLAAARFEAIKADVLAHLADPTLNLQSLAERQKASSRYVQTLFERSGMTFSDFVLEQRLVLAQRLLQNPLHAGRKVAEIALMAGFQNVSYFHRAFRRRFGMTPADARTGEGCGKR